MKIIKILLAAAMVFIGQMSFAQALNKVKIYNNTHPASVEMQKQINGQMLNLLKNRQFGPIRDLVNKGQIDTYYSPFIKAKDWPAYGTNDKKNLENYIDEIKDETYILSAYKITDNTPVENDFHRPETRITTISVSKAFYYALTKYYTELYGDDPLKFNLDNYKNFYQKFKGAWFAGQVEDTMALIWQNGEYFSGNLYNADGAKIYNAVYVAKRTGFKDPYKYVRTIPNFHSHKMDVLNNLDRIYGAMYERSLQTKDKGPFHTVKTMWFNDLLDPVPGNDDKPNMLNLDTVYILNPYDSVLGNMRDGWDVMAISPVTKDQIEFVQYQYDYCLKNPAIKDKIYCYQFKAAARKHGYFPKTDAELKEELKQAANTEKKNPRTALGLIWPNK